MQKKGKGNMHQFRKEWLVLATCFWLLLGMLTGCSVKPEKESQSVLAEKEKLLVWSYYETEAQQKSLDRLMADFNASQELYEARWEYVPMTEFTKRLAIGVTEEELPDVVIIDNPDMGTYVSLGLFEDITAYVKEWEGLQDYYPQTLQTVMLDEKYYGIPFCCNNLALIYNVDLFEEKGMQPPESWEEFQAAAKALSDQNTYGFAMSAVEGEQSAFQVLPWILAQGSVSGDFTEEEAVEAFNKIRELVSSGVLDPNCVNWSQNDVARKFIAGEAAMMENGPWILPMLKESGVHYGIVELPFGPECHTITGGENMGVMKGKNVEGAVALLKYYSSDKMMQQVCSGSNVLPPKKMLAQESARQNPDMKIFENQMQKAVARSTIPAWESKAKQLPKALYSVITMEKTPEQAAEELNLPE